MPEPSVSQPGGFTSILNWLATRSPQQVLAVGRFNPYLGALMGVGKYFASRSGYGKPVDPNFVGPPSPATGGGGLLGGTLGWLGDHAVPTNMGQTWQDSSWMRSGNITNPFQQNSFDQTDMTADSLSNMFSGMPSDTGAPGPGAMSGRPGRGGYMGNPYMSAPSMTQMDLGNGLTIPIINGPQWTGPKGLPWTAGADPASYPYSYIPPNGSWAGVDWFHLPGAQQGAGGSNPGMMGGNSGGPLGQTNPGMFRDGRGGLLGSDRDVNFGPGMGYTDAGAFVNGQWSNGGWDSGFSY